MISVKLRLKEPNNAKVQILQAYTDEFSRCVRWWLTHIQEEKTTSRKNLHRGHYREARAGFDMLASQIGTAMDKAIEMQRSFLKKKGKRGLPKLNGSIACFKFDTYRITPKAIILHFSNHQILNLPYHVAPNHRGLILGKHGRGELRRVDGRWYFYVPVHPVLPEPFQPEGVIGIDLGLAKLAALSSGRFFRGEQARFVRNHYAKKRAELQQKNANGSKNAYRVLKRLSGKEARWIRDMNHKISCAIVNLGRDTKSAIALENLEGIRGRIKAPKKVRRMLNSWAFRELRFFIEYKSQLAGVPCVTVDPRHTSTRCSRCGELGVRPRQSEFVCGSCGYHLNADLNAARNIATLGSLSLGHAPGEKGCLASALM